MVSRNLFLLASALPLAVWLQGCKKDKTKDPKKEDPKKGDKETKPPADTTPAETKKHAKESYEQYFTGGDKRALMAEMLQQSDVEFEQRVPLFTNTKQVSATVVPAYTTDVSQPVVPVDMKYQELIQEYRVEVTASNSNYNAYQHQLLTPGALNNNMISNLVANKQYPYMLNQRRATQMNTAETILVDYVVAAGDIGVNAQPTKYLIIAELYTHGQGKSAFPKGNSFNFVTVFMPFSDNPQLYFEICVKTFYHILAISHAVNLEVSDEQRLIWDNMSNADKGTAHLDPWAHYRDTQSQSAVVANVAGRMVIAGNIGSRCPAPKWRSNQSHERMLVEARRLYEKIQYSIRSFEAYAAGSFPTVTGVDINGAPKSAAQMLGQNSGVANYQLGTFEETVNGVIVYNRIDLSKPTHMKWFMEHFAHENDDFRRDLKELKKLLDWIFHEVDEYVVADATNAVAACPAGTTEILRWDGDQYSAPAACKASFADHNGVGRMCYPTFILERMHADQEILPASIEQWEEFRMSSVRGLANPSRYLMPKQFELDSLQSYTIKTVQVIHPGKSVAPIFAEVMVVAFYHAFRQSKQQYNYHIMPQSMILGDSNAVLGGGVQNNGMNYQNDITRPLVLRRDYLVQKLVFVTLTAQLEGEDAVTDFKTIAKNIADQEIEIIVKEGTKTYTGKVMEAVPHSRTNVPGVRTALTTDAN